jgi:flagellar biosynthesis/type III secretory pathway M-ring protein FliF/YscJ
MNKRRLHHTWTRLRLVKPWYFLIIAIISTVVCVFALRANNQHMVTLRNDVYKADQKNTDVEGALRQLQAYVTAHMNTSLTSGAGSVYPPIQLKYTYERLLQAQQSQLAQTNTQLYTEAQHYCEQQNPTDFSGHNRVPCIEQYVSSRTPDNVQLPAISPSLYQFSFASPTWSPDLAGWSLAVTALSGLLFVVTLLAGLWFRRNT